jgi:hypothetical protein
MGCIIIILKLNLPKLICAHSLAPAISCGAIRRQRHSLKNPTKTVDEFLAILQKQQLPQTVSTLKSYIDLL